MRRSLVIVILAVAIAGCASTEKAQLQVRVSFDETVDFSTWKTFRFATFGTDGADGSGFMQIDRDLRQAIEENLTGRGYVRIEDGTPDFRIASRFGTRGDSGSDMDRRYANEPTTTDRANPTITNSLDVEMLDPVSGEVLWSGRVSGFALGAIQHKNEIRGAVWRLFVEFPPITR